MIIKSLIEFGLKKPVLNHVMLTAVIILAFFSYLKIPKEIFPVSVLDVVSITGSYSGSSSDMLDKIAVDNIENELIALSSIDKINTIVKNGMFKINAQLKKDIKVSDTLDDIKDIVSMSKKDLPSDMEEPTVKVLKQSFPLITVALYSSNISNEKLLNIAKKVKNRLMKVDNLVDIYIWEDSKKELLIKFDENKIEAYGLNKLSVINTISSISTIFPIGKIKDKSNHYYLSTFNGEKNIKNIENMILKIDNKNIYLKDIATIKLGLSDSSTKSHFNSKPNISIGINKGKKGDAVELVKKIKNILENEYQKNYDNLDFDTYSDTSVWIKNRLNTVVSNILFGLFLLFLAITFFINIRISIIVAIGIPTSFFIGLILLNYLDYSLNMLTLLGALIALGMLVDEAVVVAENIYRHMEMGKDKLQACIDGAMEIYPAILAATATTILTFLPILIMDGQTGNFIKVLPILISILLLSSLLEAFYFLPLHAKQLLKIDSKTKKSDLIWIKFKSIYMNILNIALKGKYISIFILVITIFFITFILVKKSKFVFMPPFDTTQIYITGSSGIDKTLEQTEKLAYKVEKKLMKNVDFNKDVDSISSIIGLKLDGKNLPQIEEYYFHIFINLYERAPDNFFNKYINPYLSPKYDDSNMIRKRPAQEIKDEILLKLESFIKNNNFKELNIFVPQTGIVTNDIEISLNGNKDNILKATKNIKNTLSKINGVSNIIDDSSIGNIELKFKVNDYGKQLGITETMILSQLRPFYFKGAYSKMFDDKGIVNIIIQSINKDILSSIYKFNIELINGKKVLLKDIVTIVKQNAFTKIIKENNKRITTITASISNITSSEVYEKLNPLLESLKKEVNINIKGEEAENQKVQKEMLEAFLLGLLLIFIVLVIMFDSIVKPFIILSTIPLSLFGVLIGHSLLNVDIGMPSLIGIVGLAGVIVNDGILMMDFIKKSNSIEELKHYSLLRLRPILITSFTTILGLSTLIFLASGQALILQPMAISLGFGLLGATILNLYYIPMVYRIIYLNKSNH